MNRFLIGAVGLALAGVLGSAVAGEVRDGTAAASQKASMDAVQQGLERMGYRVLRIDVQEDRYEFGMIDESGILLRATYDAATGELVNATLD